MLFTKADTTREYLYPGHPVAAPVSEKVVSSLGRAADVLLVASGTPWARPAGDLNDLRAKLRRCGQGEELVSRAIALASTGLRVAAFSTPTDAHLLVKRIATRPFPIAIVIHAIGACKPSESGFGFHLSAASPQESLDFSLIAQRVAETDLIPVVCAHRSFGDPSEVGTFLEPEPGLVSDWLGEPGDTVGSTAPAHRMLFGDERRRIPAVIDLDRPVGIGLDLHGRMGTLARAGTKPFYVDPAVGAIESSFDEFGSLTGRFHKSLSSRLSPDGDYVVVTDGPSEALEFFGSQVAPRLGAKLRIEKLSVLVPFPLNAVAESLRGCTGASVIENGDGSQTILAEQVRRSLQSVADRPAVHEIITGSNQLLGPEDVFSIVQNMLAGKEAQARLHPGVRMAPRDARVPSLESLYQTTRRLFPAIAETGAAETVQRSPETTPPKRDAGLLVVCTSEEPVSAISVGAASASLDVLKRPAATYSERLVMPGGDAVQSILSVGSVSPAEARIGPIDTVVSTRADVLGRLTSDPRLVHAAKLVIPRWMTSRMTSKVIKRIGEKELEILEVELDEALPEAEALAVLVSAWAKLTGIPGAADTGYQSAWLQRLTSQLHFDRSTKERVANLVVSAEAVTRQVPDHSDFPAETEPAAPAAIRRAVERAEDFADAGRFWRTVGYSFATQTEESLSPDPYISSNLVPARTGTFTSSAASIEQLPSLSAENCTACGRCAAYCPEGAIRTGLASIEGILESGIERVGAAGTSTIQLDRVATPIAKQAQRIVARDELNQHRTLGEVLELAMEPVLEAMKPAEETKRDLLDGFAALLEGIGSIQLTKTEAFFTGPESKAKGSGRLFLWSVNPDACTTCGICTAVCEDDALDMRVPSVEGMDQSWRLAELVAQSQPESVSTTDDRPMDYLMGRQASDAVSGSARANPGNGVRMTVRLVCSLVEDVVGPRLAAVADEAGELSDSIRDEITRLLRSAVDVNDFEAFGKELDLLGSGKASVADLLGMVDGVSTASIDTGRLGKLTQVLTELEAARRALDSGRSGEGKARMAAVFGAGRNLAVARSFPFNPYPFPWINAADASPLAAAEGLFEGLSAQMCATFAVLRRARKLVKGLDPGPQDRDLSWTQLTEDEWEALPPVCVFTESESDIPGGWLSSTLPIRIFVLDGNEALPHVGWGAKIWPLVRADAYALHSAASEFDHFSEGVRAGLTYRGPAVYRLYAPDPIADDFATDATVARMAAAVRSRLFPLLQYDPRSGAEWTDRWSLDGNESPAEDWVSALDTPAHWMLGEGRFRSYFDPDPEGLSGKPDLYELLKQEAPESGDVGSTMLVPIEGREVVVGLAPAVVECTLKTRAFWRLLQELAGVRSTALTQARREAREAADKEIAAARAEIESEAQAEVDRIKREHDAIYQQKLTERLLAMSGYGPGSEAHDRLIRELTESI